MEAPGEELFTAARTALGELPIVAENLGVITPAVEAIRTEFGFPGYEHPAVRLRNRSPGTDSSRTTSRMTASLTPGRMTTTP